MALSPLSSSSSKLFLDDHLVGFRTSKTLPNKAYMFVVSLTSIFCEKLIDIAEMLPYETYFETNHLVSF